MCESNHIEGLGHAKVNVLGLQLADMTRPDLVDHLATIGMRSAQNRPVTAFALHIGGLLSAGDSTYQNAMASADVVYADGISAQLLGRIAGARRIERAVTTDIGWEVLQAMRQATGRVARVAMVGGPDGLAELALSVLEEAGVATKVFSTHGFHDNWVPVLASMRRTHPDVIFVGLGAPKEMLWVHDNCQHLPAALIMTCGGWFGYIVGNEPRAPDLVRRFGLEWAYRLKLQPRRLGKRYIRGFMIYPSLVLAVLRERYRSIRFERRNPENEL